MRKLELHDLIHTVGRSGSRVALLLGAGASVTSGIPTASQLVASWRGDLHGRALSNGETAKLGTWVRNEEKEYSAWLLERHPESDPDSKRYGYTFERVAPTRAQRQHVISTLCEGARPKAGYYALAALMDAGVFDTVLTTNFDDLLADACFDVGSLRPQVSAHTETVRMVRLLSPRPKIIKLHGDYLFDDLQNTDLETQSLRRGMDECLRQVNHEFGLLVVGYGGNDDSIMGVLESLEGGNPQGIFWCVRADSTPNKRVVSLMEKYHDAYLVPVDGFDELMVDLFRALGGDLARLETRRTERSGHVQKTLQVLAGDQPTQEAVAQADDQLSAIPFMVAASRFLEEGSARSAVISARRAVQHDPSSSLAYWVLGASLYGAGELDDAKEAAAMALSMEPERGTFVRLASSIAFATGDLAIAVSLAERAVQLEPDSASSWIILAIARRDSGDLASAKDALVRAEELEPNNAIVQVNLGSVLFAQGDIDDAKEAFQKALEIIAERPTPHTLRMAAGLALTGLERREEAVEAFRGWCAASEAPVRGDVIRFLRYLADHGHDVAAQVLVDFRSEGLASL